jgi:holo-[acyl-carrier protein] synthase
MDRVLVDDVLTDARMYLDAGLAAPPSEHPGTPAGSRVLVGVDLTRIAEVAASIERFGDRYLQRLFTEHELASCPGHPDTVAAGLAARFAAKEATIKVLKPVAARPDWRSMEVHRAPSGACEMRLTDAAARRAHELGITDLAVSLSHEGDLAAAVVVALVDKEVD